MNVSTYRRALNERPAHESVSALAASRLWERDLVDWPVSGDETLRAHGTIGARNAAKRANIWNAVQLRGIYQDMEAVSLA